MVSPQVPRSIGPSEIKVLSGVVKGHFLLVIIVVAIRQKDIVPDKNKILSNRLSACGILYQYQIKLAKYG